MNDKFPNPFANHPDKAEIWSVVAQRDAEAFATNNWKLHANDFCPDEFYGMTGNNDYNPDNWTLKYENLEAYHQDWIEMRSEFNNDDCKSPVYDQLLSAITLTDIELKGNLAIVHKTFNGTILMNKGEDIELKWRSMFYLKKKHGRWLVTSLLGFLPFGG